MGELAGGKVHPAEEADASGIAEGGDQAVGLLVDEAARHRAEAARATDASARVSGYWARRGEIGVLELVLERDPVVPDVVERLAEHVLELAGVEGLGILRPAQPFDRSFRRRR